ncbi:hypothetical protein GGP85_003295 [Salinibacter ruber]|nr:hypothetical protein [Salinibacter ruber]MCS3827824.1 hypothetical protein [Salinibacter ruber]MCS4146094.1 hypothetical protein [Salinibacter ruber]
MEGRLSSHKRNQATVLTKGPSPHTFTHPFLPRAYFQAPTVSPFCVPAFAARGFSLSARLHERVSGRTLPVAAGPFAPTGPLAKRPCPRNGPQHRAPLAVRNAGRTRVRRDHPPAKEQRRHDIAAEACSGRFRVAAAGGPWRSWSDAAPPPLRPSRRAARVRRVRRAPSPVPSQPAMRCNGPPRDGALRHTALHKLQSSMDGFLSRFTPKLRKMRSIKSQWHMWKPARRQSVRTAHEAPADGRKEDENAAAEK